MTSYLSPPHFGAFMILFLLSTLRAEVVLPFLPISFAPLALMLLASLAFLKVHCSVGIKRYFIEHRQILLLIAGYQLLCLVSLFLNRNTYESAADFIRWGVTFIAIQTACPLAVVLFFLPPSSVRSAKPNNQAARVLLFTFFTALFGLGIWQSLDILSSQNVTQFFISSELGDSLSSRISDKKDIDQIVATNISSVFAIRTDFGAVAAVASLCFFFLHTLREQKDETGHLFFALACLSIVAGILSGARVYILALAVGSIYFYAKAFKTTTVKQTACIIALVTSVTSLCVLFLPSHAAAKLYGFLPAIAKVNLGMPLYPQDFLFTFKTDIFAGRYELWERALTSVSESPIMGISNGAFRLSSSSTDIVFTLQNTHNMFIQSLVDAGLLGFIIFVSLWVTLFKKLDSYPYCQVLYITITASLFVDNFIDHSLPWIITTTYLLSLVYHQEKDERLNSTSPSTLRIPLKLTLRKYSLIVFGLAMATAILYEQRKREFGSMPLHEQLQSVNYFIAPNMWESDPVLISYPIADKIKNYRSYGVNSYFSAVVSPCDYNYPNGAYYHNDVIDINAGTIAISNSSNSLFLTPTRQFSCDSNFVNPLDFSHWVSNHWRFIENYRRYVNPSKSIILKYDHITLWTPVFDGSHHPELKFSAKGVAVDGVNPTLRISVLSSNDGEVLREIDTEISSVQQEYSFALPTNKIYIKLKLINYRHNAEKKEYQSVTMYR